MKLPRTGIGLDVHPLVKGRPLILGGVNIPYELGLSGHSDADVLIHAICDALLGAAALGDIGQHFPDTDPQYKNINSQILLKRTDEKLKQNNFKIINLDTIIVAEKPKLSPHYETMQQNIAACLGITISEVNIKATTTEKLGFIGSGQGIAAYAIASIIKK